jgi:glycosyltransferase involved in cell wall biosynthesis
MYSIVYTGGLGHGRWISIVDLDDAAELLRERGHKILITIFANEIPAEAINILRKRPNIHLLPPPNHEELPCYLKGADILYLPETFDTKEARVVRLSISTKAHLYMMSEVPILVYASQIAGVLNYARVEGWACIVCERNDEQLALALNRLFFDFNYRKELVARGTQVALKNHDKSKIEKRFLNLLNEIIELSH